ncbi:uncharacterized protein EI90DRAFT_3027677 [Cantharellus anzutake]|uniref:uncharacterized protein n=1 Tax=Cantharellus anzutake TaxID=1750568 RepID=UPI0019085949|nr:uncharacterized protein EI90DRAFT_3027677 [Cantharellus anzutake]KAF8343958.1 hypothetical protein EI90DRAFT_3027677 [Cantharellus anzutake]
MDSSSRDEGSLIEIDTSADWKRIQDHFTNAIHAVLDAELDKSASKGSRDTLLQHLHQWRNEAMEYAKSNIRINGVDPEEACDKEDMEPYDEALNVTVWAMDNERLAYDHAVSEKRRRIPREVRDLTDGILAHERSAEVQVPGRDFWDEERMEVDFKPLLSNLAEIVETHQVALDIGEGVKLKGPILAVRAQRALEVVTEMSTLPS